MFDDGSFESFEVSLPSLGVHDFPLAIRAKSAVASSCEMTASALRGELQPNTIAGRVCARAFVSITKPANGVEEMN